MTASSDRTTFGDKVELFSADMERLLEPRKDALLKIGRRWISGNEATERVEFREMVNDLISNGRSDRMFNSCHRLLGEQSNSSSETVADLTEMIGQVGDLVLWKCAENQYSKLSCQVVTLLCYQSLPILDSDQ